MMRYANCLMIRAFFCALCLLSPQTLADSPEKEAWKARQEQLKSEYEWHKKFLEQQKEEQKKRLEYEREFHKNYQEIRREERKAREEMERERRKHYEEILKESDQND